MISVIISHPLLYFVNLSGQTASIIDAREVHMHARDSVADLFVDSWIAEKVCAAYVLKHVQQAYDS